MRIRRSGEALSISGWRKRMLVQPGDLVGVDIRSQPLWERSTLISMVFPARPRLRWIQLTTASDAVVLSCNDTGFKAAVEWLKQAGWNLDEAAPRSLQQRYEWISLTQVPPRSAGGESSTGAPSGRPPSP